MIDFAPEETLPHDDEAERTLLSDAIIDNKHLPYFCQHAPPELFYRMSHRHIAEAIHGLFAERLPVDLITLKTWLARADHLDDLGIPPPKAGPPKYPRGAAYLSSIVDGGHKAANIEGHLEAVLSWADRREYVSFAHIACNGSPDDEIRERFTQLGERMMQRRALPRPVDLASVEPTFPAFVVPGLIRKSGLHLVWAEPNAGKTYLLLLWMLELLSRPTPEHLCGHPGLPIIEPFNRVLWLGTEEDSGILRARMDRVLKGLKAPDLGGEIMHLWASTPGRRITLDDLPALLRREGPVNGVVLDSLTGLRPKTVNGERVRWDLDNDRANEACLTLRGLTREHNVAIFLVHHTGRDTSKGYRGPTDWWASADIQLGILPEGPDRLRVKPEKNREGRRLDPFILTRSFADGAFTATYDGTPETSALSPCAEKLDAHLKTRGRASQAEISKATGIHRNTVSKAAQECMQAGLWRYTNETRNNSPVFERVLGPRVAEPSPGPSAQGEEWPAR